jgi:bile acid-coenzyme A ligase
MTLQIPVGFVSTYHARNGPRRPMLSLGDETITREVFEARANRRARQLAALGVAKDNVVAIVLPNRLELFELAAAVWKLGATVVPLAHTLPDAELFAILALIAPRLIASDDPARLHGYPVLDVGVPVDGLLSAEYLPEIVPSYWRYSTSGGSTGRPKVIVDHHPPFRDPAAAGLGQRVDGVMLNPGPLYHSGPFSLTHAALFVGNHVVNMTKFDALEVLRLIERHQVDWLYLVPTMMNRIWRLAEEERNRFDLSSLAVAFHMASACPVWLKEKWIGWLGPDRIWELYSGTESFGSTIISGREWLEHKGSVGRVVGERQILILDAGGRSCAPGEVGEIVFVNPDTAAATYHYIGAEPRLIGRGQSLGDMGYLDEDGYLFVVDRRTDMVVSGGANVYTAEVEAAMEWHQDVECCIVVGLPDEDLVNRVHAIVQLAPGSQVGESELRDFLKARLAPYKVPRSFELVDEPLRDSAGKVRRSALRDARIQHGKSVALAT